MNPQDQTQADELKPPVAMWQLKDLEDTIADASPEELPELHSKLLALSTGLTEAIDHYANQRALEAIGEDEVCKECKNNTTFSHQGDNFLGTCPIEEENEFRALQRKRLNLTKEKE